MLDWLAFSKNRVFEVTISTSDLAIKQNIIREECLERWLIPLIKMYHSNGNFIFRPDLVPSLYAESVSEQVINSKIDFLAKFENPATLPECQPIEEFRTIIKQKAYAGAQKAKDLIELQKKHELASKKSTLVKWHRYLTVFCQS